MDNANDDFAISPTYESDGPIKCIFLAEFHPTAGPKITCQVPDDYISKDTFEAVSVYIIPKAQLQRSTLTLTAFNHKILGYPVKIDSNKYARNALYFNLCFVFDAKARTVQYESVVKKLSEYLTAMEVETAFLLEQEKVTSFRKQLVNMLKQVLYDLNRRKMCTLTEGTMTTHLMAMKMSEDPVPTLDHEVPVFLETLGTFQTEQWDLTTQQVLPYIDGINHVAKIAVEADVDTNLVKACLQNLVYYGVVKMAPIFQYSNVYAVTSKLHQLAMDKQLAERCLRSVGRPGRCPPNLRDVFRLYSNMSQGTTVRDLCARYNPAGVRVDERRLVQFGVLEELIRRVHKYPVALTEGTSNPTHQLFNGLHSLDEICCMTGLTSQQVEEQVEKDQNVLLLWK